MFTNKPVSKPLKLFNQKMTARFYKLITRARYFMNMWSLKFDYVERNWCLFYGETV